MKKSILLIGTILLLANWNLSFAAPADPGLHDIIQSDGTSFKAKGHGDEFENWIEAVDSGHTVIRNKRTGHWEYAEKQPDGTLATSGVKVDPSGQNVPHYIPKRIKPDRDREHEQYYHESLRRVLHKRLGPVYSVASGEQRTSQTFSGPTYGPMFAPGDWMPTPVEGNSKLLVVLINFANRTFLTSTDNWSQAIFDTSSGVKSVANFFNQNSFGKLNVVPAFTGGTHPGVVAVTIADNHPNSGNNFNYISEINILNHALAQAAATVDLSGFDPDSDEVYFIYAGYEKSGSTKTPNIWGHAWSGMLNLGGMTLTHWAINGELSNSDIQHSIGVMVHELGHSLLGLPDLYDTSLHNAGLGNFSLMASGCWGMAPNEYSGTTPVALDAWSREYLGWTAPIAPASSGQVSLGTALASSENAIKMINPASSITEYWLAENRYPAQGSWDEGIKGLITGYTGGLLITHIDITSGTKGYNDINKYGIGPHQGVMAEQAKTTTCNMLTTACRGSSLTTFFSGNNANFAATTVPASSYYNNTASNLGLINISASGTTMTAEVKLGASLSVTDFSVPPIWKTLAVPVTAFNVSSGNPIKGYMITLSPTAPLATATGWLAAKPASFKVKTGGIYTLYSWAKDSTGNVSSSANSTVNVDLTRPVVTSFSVFTPVNSLTIPVKDFTASDDNSGITGYLISESTRPPLSTASGWSDTVPGSYTTATPGAKRLYAWVKDNAGNVSLSKSALCITDPMQPIVTAFTLPTTPVRSLTVRIISLKATDKFKVVGFQVTENQTTPDASDSNWKTVAPLTYSFADGTSGGSKTLYAWALDAAGNVSIAKTATVVLDMMPPTITSFVVPQTSKSLTVPVTLMASDNINVTGYMITKGMTMPLATATGWKPTVPTSFKVISGNNTLYAWAKDAAGNVSLSTNASVIVQP